MLDALQHNIVSQVEWDARNENGEFAGQILIMLTDLSQHKGMHLISLNNKKITQLHPGIYLLFLETDEDVYMKQLSKIE